MRYFFTADWHINHGNIIEYCDRPFATVEEMNETIIKNHNARVKDEDTVFFLGDFSFKNSKGGKVGEGLPIKAEDIIKRLNGRFVFVKGNHDRNNSLKTIIERVVIKYGKFKINLVHNPEFVDYSCDFNFIAHVHNHWKFKVMTSTEQWRGTQVTNCINVGVDVNDFRPKTFEELYSEYIKWTKGITSVSQKTSSTRDK